MSAVKGTHEESLKILNSWEPFHIKAGEEAKLAKLEKLLLNEFP